MFSQVGFNFATLNGQSTSERMSRLNESLEIDQQAAMIKRKINTLTSTKQKLSELGSVPKQKFSTATLSAAIADTTY